MGNIMDNLTVIILGRVLPLLEMPGSEADVNGWRVSRALCPSSICWRA
jgi:hypothetical protein